MITDEQILEFSIDIDNFLIEKSLKYTINPLQISAIINARLLLLNQVAENEQNFKDLLSSIANTQLKPEAHTIQ